MANKPAIHLLTGCTAVGKTDAALAWAVRHEAEIVSCDALLFYRGMDIGTAKPTAAERARVPHHLIDVCAPDEPMDIARYVGLARAAVADIIARGRRVLVTGGSGFYLKAFVAPVVDDVDVPPAIRDRVRRLAPEAALAELRAVNPEGLAGLDVANPRRVQRALERCLASGRTLADLQAAFARRPSAFAGYDVRLTELVREPADLAARIERRVTAMLAAGLVPEVAQLRVAGIERNPSAAAAIGYREVIAHLDGTLPAAELADAISRNTRGLVKKQRTWFRTQLPAHARLDAEGAGVDALFPA